MKRAEIKRLDMGELTDVLEFVSSAMRDRVDEQHESRQSITSAFDAMCESAEIYQSQVKVLTEGLEKAQLALIVHNRTGAEKAIAEALARSQRIANGED